MQLGMIGLGRMGANIVRRLMRAGHECVVFDRDPSAGAQLASDGAEAAGGLAGLVRSLAPPRAVWIMVPAGEATESTVRELAPLLSPGDTPPLQARHSEALPPTVDTTAPMLTVVGQQVHREASGETPCNSA